MLSEMYHMQRSLQINSFKKDPFIITQSGDMSYIKDMVLGMSSELHELLNEVSWKPWTSGTPYINEDLYRKELVDVFHFFLNLMLAVDMSPTELYEMYAAKNKINAERQLSDYDGVTTKCANCRRALEDVSISQVHSFDNPSNIDMFLCECGYVIPSDIAVQFIHD